MHRFTSPLVSLHLSLSLSNHLDWDLITGGFEKKKLDLELEKYSPVSLRSSSRWIFRPVEQVRDKGWQIIKLRPQGFIGSGNTSNAKDLDLRD